MADTKLALMTAASALSGTDLFYTDQSGDRKATGTQIKALVLAGAITTLGAADAAAPVAQTLNVQNVVTGTTDTAGANLTIGGSKGTGNGNGGSIIFQVATATSTGSTPNALVPALEISGQSGSNARVIVGTSFHLFVSGGTKGAIFATSNGNSAISIGGSGTNYFAIGPVGNNVAALGYNGGSAGAAFTPSLQWGDLGIVTLGPADAAAPVAQTLTVQSVVAGTSNTAGANFTIAGSKGTGTGAGGSIVFQTAPVGGSGSSQNALATVLTIDSTKLATFAGDISVPSDKGVGRGSLGSTTGNVIFYSSNVVSSAYLQAANTFDIGGSNVAFNTPLTGPAAATLQLGVQDAAAPVAQTLTVQSVVAGTSNTAGQNWTFKGSRGTGTGIGGSLIFQTAPAGTTGNSQNALATALTIDSTKLATFTGDVLTRGLRSNAVTFSNAISSPVEGTLQAFTDSTASSGGTVITGGGSNHVLGYYTGTNWVVASGTGSGGGGLAVGSTAISGGTSTRLLYDNAGTLGETTVTFSGGVTNFPAGAFNAPSLIFAGDTGTGFYRSAADKILISVSSNPRVGFTGSGMLLGSDYPLSWTNNNATDPQDTWIYRGAAATIRFGADDNAAPVAQTLTVQSVIAGTSNTTGADFTISGSKGTGTGAGGSIVFQTAAAGSTGTSQNTLAAALTLNSAKLATFGGSVTTTATDANSFGSVTLKVTSAVLRAGLPIFEDSGNVRTMFNGSNPGIGFCLDTRYPFTFSSAGDTPSAASFQGSIGAAFCSPTTATFQHGLFDAAAPVAQTLQVQSVVAGTVSGTVGQNFTINGSRGTGTGIGGSIIFQTAAAGGVSTAQNALAPALTLNSAKLATFGGGIALAAGSATVAPLVFASGTSLTTAAAGALEYDGKVHYATSVASARQIINAEQVQNLTTTRTLANNTTAQAIFNATTNGALTLAAATTYEFEMLVAATGFSASAHTLNFGFGGTATFTSVGYFYDAQSGSTLAGPAASFTGFIAVATASAVVASGTTTGLVLRVRGTIRINAGGTVIPQLTQVTASAAAVVQANSFFRCWPAGSDTTASVGNWS